MLKGSGARRLGTNTCRMWGGNAVAGIYGLGLTALNSNFVRGNGVLRNASSGPWTVSNVTNRAGIPNGYRAPASWNMPMKAGGLSTQNEVYGAGTFVGAGTLGKNAAAALTGSGDLTATAQLIVSLLATIAGSGTISNADLKAYLNLAATIAGNSGLAAVATAIAHAEAALTGTGDAVAVPRAVGVLAADVTVTGTGLTTSNVGSSVWNALAAAFNDSGTMGAKLNAASAGGVDINELADAVVAAIMAAAQATPIHADAKKMNGADIAGTGQPGDLWRGA